MNTRNILFASLLVGLLSGVAGAFLFSFFNQPTTYFPSEAQRPAASWANNASNNTLPDFVKASEVSTQSVVYIKTVSAKQARRYTWHDLFFNPGAGNQQQAVNGSGSGVIFSSDGYIVTNNHVIAGADEIQVVHQKRTYLAKLVGTDPSTDLALLKIEAQQLPAIPIGSAKNLAVGDWVLAVGNPFNLTSTVTAGIVSAKGRKINILEGLFPIESFIQTDAAINPGNSGGALVNRNGELVGINTAILSQTGSYSGYGFAVPIDIAVKIVDDLKKHGQVQKAFMGVDVMDITEEVSNKLKVSTFDGALITRVSPDGAGAKAGLEGGDILISLNGEPIDSQASFDEHLGYYAPGSQVRVGFLRDGKQKEATLTLTNVEGTTGVAKRELVHAGNLGASFEVVPKVERERLGIENGIRIAKTEPAGLMSRMGLGEGFVVVAVNNYKIESVENFVEVLERAQGRVVVQGVDKAGQYKYFSYYF